MFSDLFRHVQRFIHCGFIAFTKKRLKSAPNCRRFEKQVSDARVIYLALAAQVSDLEGCEDVLDYEDEG